MEAISRVVRYIQFSLDEVIAPRELAALAGFSPHHFHRVFRAIVGESVMDFIRRLRLERAAWQLRASPESVLGIAIDAGYGSQEAFARVFHAYFGMSARAFRASSLTPHLPNPSGIHHAPGQVGVIRWIADREMLIFDGLCDFHRQWPDRCVDTSDFLVTLLTQLSSFTHPAPPQEFPMLEAQTDIDREIDNLQKEVDAAKQRLSDARRRRPKEPVTDYELLNPDGSTVRLSELFGDKEDLILIHNMGTGCSACTMWADGFNGLQPHLNNRAAFVVCSPDKPDVQRKFAENRKWRFRMVSAHDTTLFQDLGFWGKGPWPGVSTFRREQDGTVVRVGKTYFDDGDDFCAAWPLFDLLEGGSKGWQPKFDYGETAE